MELAGLEPATSWVRFREDRPSAPEVRYFSRSIARRSSSFDLRERPLMPNLSASRKRSSFVSCLEDSGEAPGDSGPPLLAQGLAQVHE
jgi:hypothetical protein